MYNASYGHACIQALASDAATVVKIDNAILTHEQGLSRANGGAGGIGTVIAPGDGKHAFCVRERSFLDLFNPCPVYANGNFMLRFTGHGTGMAANAFPVIDYKAVLHFNPRFQITLSLLKDHYLVCNISTFARWMSG